jgi:hypothetical protein
MKRRSKSRPAGVAPDDTDRVRGFASEHHIDPAGLIPSVRALLGCIEEAHAALATELGENIPTRPSWAILWTLAKRCTEHAQAIVALWATGFPAQAEVASRSVFEHATTVLYILLDKTEEALGAYFQSFVSREGRFLLDLKGTQSTELRSALQAREGARKHRETAVGDLLREMHLDPSLTRKWPSLLDRCRAIGLEEEYRLFYSQMSAQGHADPEDVLNEMMVSAHAPQLLEKLAVETVEFSWTMSVHAIRSYLRMVASMLAGLSSGSRVKLVLRLVDRVPLTILPRSGDPSHLKS